MKTKTSYTYNGKRVVSVKWDSGLSEMIDNDSPFKTAIMSPRITTLTLEDGDVVRSADLKCVLTENRPVWWKPWTWFKRESKMEFYDGT